eukprot:5513771-Prymnesium_polylepis.4
MLHLLYGYEMHKDRLGLRADRCGTQAIVFAAANSSGPSNALGTAAESDEEEVDDGAQMMVLYEWACAAATLFELFEAWVESSCSE